ncbi:head-tail connector protein [Sporosarcina sp. FSL K6-3457]|uniref:head-tail connector protein n=1 Tax=Sporosarcina sp. FSL K6-3457 TaxID=2978204 RepID=UPI0030F9E82F
MILTLEETKEWLRVDIEDDDSMIRMLTEAAEAYLKNATGKDFDETNKQAKLFCLVLVMDWYENREMNNFRVGEKVRYTVESMIAQLTYC